jgi:hypothetical protein
MFSWIALAAASMAQSPLADAAPPADSGQIIVKGVRQRNRAIHDFVAAVTPAPIGGQLRRYQNEVCPAATGLPDAQNMLIGQRLRQVAAAAGIPLAHEGCGPNALLIVVDDKKEFIAALRRRYPIYFSDPVNGSKDPPHELGPATAWHVEGMLTANHTPAPQQLIYHYYIVSSTDSSRLRPPSIPHFVAGVLVVERRSLAGLTTTQLADYAAMRLYATTKPQKLKSTASSILGVLEAPMGSAIPLSLTNWDLSFLKSLYAIDDRQYANLQRSRIERVVRKDHSPTK